MTDWTRPTFGQVASTIMTPFLLRVSRSWGEMPWARMMTVVPSSIPSRSFKGMMPRFFRSSTVWGLWMRGPKV